MKKILLSLLFIWLILMPTWSLAITADDFIVSDEPGETDRYYFYARMIMADMTLEEKVAQLFVVTPEALSGEEYTLNLTADFKENLQKYPVGGIVLFGQNIASAGQVTELIGQLQDIAEKKHGISMLLVAEEEGGRVSRLAMKLGLEETDSMAELGMRYDLSEAYRHGQFMAQRLREYGFNMNLAPLADVPGTAQDMDVLERSFGTDAEVTADMAEQVVIGTQAEHVIAVMKHFPGLVSVENERVTASETALRAAWLPFEKGIESDVGAILVTNLTVPCLDAAAPAVFSQTIMQTVLRDELKFDGVIMTDSLRDRNINAAYKPGETAVLALEAGADLIYLPEDFEAAYHGVLSALQDGRLMLERIEESVQRILALKIRYGMIEEE